MTSFYHMNIDSQLYQCSDCFNFFWESENFGQSCGIFETRCIQCQIQVKVDSNTCTALSSSKLSSRLSLSSRKGQVRVLLNHHVSNLFPTDEVESEQLLIPTDTSDNQHNESCIENIFKETTPIDNEVVLCDIASEQDSDSKSIYDENEKPIKRQKAERPKDDFFCVICHMDLSNRGLSARTSHLKKCAKYSNVSTKELLIMLEPPDIAPSSSLRYEDTMGNNSSIIESTGSNVIVETLPTSTERSIPTSAHISLPIVSLPTTKPTAKPVKASNTTTSKKRSWWSKKPSTSLNERKYAPNFKKIQTLSMNQPIVVDGFQFACRELTDCYFLTHFHSDHYIGLDKSFDCGLIYCTKTTAALVKLKLGVSPDRLIALDIDIPTVIRAGGEDVNVLLADANHCPGSVCIYFHFKSGKRVLHSGDFRWNRQSMLSSPLFRSLVYVEPASNTATNKTSTTSAIQDNKILTVYLDTTYCDPSYDFPPQDITIQAVIAEVQRELMIPNTLFLFGAYGIGKERVYMAVAEALHMKVHVDGPRYRTIMCYDQWSDDTKARITTNAMESILWVVPMNHINFHSFDKVLQQRPDCKRIVAFQPTGWTHSSSKTTSPSTSSTALFLSSKTNKAKHKIFSVPYSEHSSFSELIDCIRILRPHIVVPTVNTSEAKVKQQLALLRDASGIYDKNKVS